MKIRKSGTTGLKLVLFQLCDHLVHSLKTRATSKHYEDVIVDVIAEMWHVASFLL